MKGNPGGYDHNYVLSNKAGEFKLAAPSFGSTLRPSDGGLDHRARSAVLLGNFLDGTLTGKGGVAYGKHAGFCLEPSIFRIPSIIPTFFGDLAAGGVYRTATTYKFFSAVAATPQAEPDNHQRVLWIGSRRRRQSIECSRSNRAMVSTATKQVFSTERLMPLPRPQDSGTTPTTITSDGA